MDQDEIFVKYEIMTFEIIFQDNYNQLIHDITYELYNDLNMEYYFDKYEEHQYMRKEYSNEQNYNNIKRQSITDKTYFFIYRMMNLLKSNSSSRSIV
jgi:hypothetical protein